MEPLQVKAMIDTETYGLREDSVILSLGCILFLEEPAPPGSWKESMQFHLGQLYMEFDVADQLSLGRTTTQSTLDFWAVQKDPPTDGRVPLETGLRILKGFLNSGLHCVSEVWCRGTDFDIPLLRNAFNQFGIPIPWHYSDVRDLRTLDKFFVLPKLPRPADLKEHHALDDCRYQLMKLKQIRNFIENVPPFISSATS